MVVPFLVLNLVSVLVPVGSANAGFSRLLASTRHHYRTSVFTGVWQHLATQRISGLKSLNPFLSLVRLPISPLPLAGWLCSSLPQACGDIFSYFAHAVEPLSIAAGAKEKHMPQ